MQLSLIPMHYCLGQKRMISRHLRYCLRRMLRNIDPHLDHPIQSRRLLLPEMHHALVSTSVGRQCLGLGWYLIRLQKEPLHLLHEIGLMGS